MKRVALVVVIAVIAMMAVAAGVTWMRWQALNTPMMSADQTLAIVLERGDTLHDFINQLSERSPATDTRALYWYARLNGDDARLRAGEYAIGGGSTPIDALNQVVRGDVVLHDLTIPEGWTFRQMLTAIHEHPDVTITLADANNTEVMRRLGQEGLHPEGRFFPDTYRFQRGTTDLELLQRAFDAMQAQLDSAWAARAPDIPLTSADEALILASIIEKETSLDSERGEISGVFTRRLVKRMRLQADPTVIYGIGESFDGDIRRSDLRRDTPYNTYTRAGLPPTPIALPGRASLDAAVNPAPGDALYFMATGDGDGSHYFSATLEEHNEAVRRYLARLRKNRGG